MKRIILYKDDKYEHVLIVLPKHYEGDFHVHPGLQCSFRILDGEMIEHVSPAHGNSRDVKQNVYTAGDKGYIDDKIGSHKIRTLNGSISIHHYSKL